MKLQLSIYLFYEFFLPLFKDISEFIQNSFLKIILVREPTLDNKKRPTLVNFLFPRAISHVCPSLGPAG